MKVRRFLTFVLSMGLMLLTACGKDAEVISNLDERDANLIVVFLESKGISAKKVASGSGPAVGAANTGPKFSIHVDQKDTINAMSILNQNGLPQRQGTNLLDLFAKQGLMSSDKEETIRYQAGLAQQITNTIQMIDGVIDASVQLSFPPTEVNPGEQPISTRITAAVYVKHQGVIDDPNNHLETKIKRIVSGSITGLDLNDVTVVSDWSRFTDVRPMANVDPMSSVIQDHVNIWSMTLTKSSVARFRSIFFGLLVAAIGFALVVAWMLWKFYPILKERGMKEFFSPTPLMPHTIESEEEL
ncbi:MAG: type III secretion inner membrane ring lipoprotein SctJ [Chlamydiia bacterium]|nr:type III secretion inner membrane ring lipoprotein SctJ [Chlamydiia bacterium]